MRDDLAITVRLPEASPDAYIRMTRACREGARQILQDPLLEELAAAVSWQLVDQAVRARLQGTRTIAPSVAIEPDHVELAREYARRGRPIVRVSDAEDPQVVDLLDRCISIVEDEFGRASTPVAS